MQVRFRPIREWPGALTKYRQNDRFDTSWNSTLRQLETELTKLGAKDVVIEIALGERDIRIDGWPRSGANPSHPGVIVSFDSKYGPLRYMTDVFFDWRANLRAIVLGLEALRKVDRYGITRRGEQYTGWKALGSGIAMGASQMTYEEAIKLIWILGGKDAAPADPSSDEINDMYRQAAKLNHPDNGGREENFKKLYEAAKVVGIR